MINKIEEVLNVFIRPDLALHGGDVEIISYNNGILKIKLLGKCSICPSAAITTEELIKKEITEKISEVEDVILIQEISSELLSFAKKILVNSNT